MFLRGIEALMVQQRILIDECAKQGLLAYATEDNLDHLGVLVGTDRLAASSATVTLQFSLDSAREMATIIPEGTRATAGDGIMFATDEAAIIPPQATSTTATATCTSSGSSGNDYAPGELTNLVDPVPFVAKAVEAVIEKAMKHIDSEFRKPRNSFLQLVRLVLMSIMLKGLTH